MLRLDAVDSYYRKIHALKGVSLRVRERSICCLIGANGAGKSTLLHTLGLLTFLEKGSIRFENEIIPRHGPNRLTPIRSLIGLIFQDAKLIPELTVLDNVCLPLAHRGFGLLTKENKPETSFQMSA